MNLANALASRYERDGLEADLHRAIAMLDAANQTAPDTYRHLAELSTNLGNVLLTRFEREGELVDLAQRRHTDRALLAIERGRAVLLTDALQRSRLDLERLSTVGRPELVERYRRVTATLPQAHHD